MQIVADTHVHVYPCYDAGRGVRLLTERLGSYVTGNEQGVLVAALTERRDCRFFADIRDGAIDLASSGIATDPVAEPDAVWLRVDSEPRPLLLVAGRQIVTCERIEVLALTADLDIADGLPAREAIDRVLAAGAVPVLAWAPGKWLFTRGKLIAELLDAYGPGKLLLGDSTLRPTVWPEPILMRGGRKRGFGVVAGSDPLPFAGEESRMGQYAVRWDAPFDVNTPITSFRRLLAEQATTAAFVGRRGGPVETATRLWKNARSSA